MLQQLKQTPKLIILFFLIQLVVNLSSSVTCFPFLHYGMFSEKKEKQSVYSTYQIEVDGKILNGMDLSVQDWEILQTPLSVLDNYILSADNEKDKLYTHFFLNKLGMKNLDAGIGGNLDNTYYSDAAFSAYYKVFLEKVLSKNVQHFKVYHCQFSYTNNAYILQNKYLRIAY
jgi:hypothetical protein